MAAVSDLALIMLAATDESFAHDGMSPQRISESSPDGFLRMLADDRDRLGRGDVVTRAPVFFPGDAVEVFLDKLLSPRQSVASAH